MRDVRHVSTNMPTRTISVAFRPTLHTHPCAMRVYGHHLVCRLWLAQWVFLGGWLIMRDVHHVNTDNISCLPPYTPPPPTSTPQDMHPCAMHVYGHHLVCRWWPAQWVFVGGWLFVRDVCHISTTTPIQIISAEGSAAFRPTLHLPQCQPHRTRIRVRCVSTVITSYAGGGRPNGCLLGDGSSWGTFATSAPPRQFR